MGQNSASQINKSVETLVFNKKIPRQIANSFLQQTKLNQKTMQQVKKFMESSSLQFFLRQFVACVYKNDIGQEQQTQKKEKKNSKFNDFRNQYMLIFQDWMQKFHIETQNNMNKILNLLRILFSKKYKYELINEILLRIIRIALDMHKIAINNFFNKKCQSQILCLQDFKIDKLAQPFKTNEGQNFEQSLSQIKKLEQIYLFKYKISTQSQKKTKRQQNQLQENAYSEVFLFLKHKLHIDLYQLLKKQKIKFLQKLIMSIHYVTRQDSRTIQTQSQVANNKLKQIFNLVMLSIKLRGFQLKISLKKYWTQFRRVSNDFDKEEEQYYFNKLFDQVSLSYYLQQQKCLKNLRKYKYIIEPFLFRLKQKQQTLNKQIYLFNSAKALEMIYFQEEDIKKIKNFSSLYQNHKKEINKIQLTDLLCFLCCKQKQAKIQQIVQQCEKGLLKTIKKVYLFRNEKNRHTDNHMKIQIKIEANSLQKCCQVQIIIFSKYNISQLVLKQRKNKKKYLSSNQKQNINYLSKQTGNRFRLSNFNSQLINLEKSISDNQQSISNLIFINQNICEKNQELKLTIFYILYENILRFLNLSYHRKSGIQQPLKYFIDSIQSHFNKSPHHYFKSLSYIYSCLLTAQQFASQVKAHLQGLQVISLFIMCFCNALQFGTNQGVQNFYTLLKQNNFLHFCSQKQFRQLRKLVIQTSLRVKYKEIQNLLDIHEESNGKKIKQIKQSTYKKISYITRDKRFFLAQGLALQNIQHHSKQKQLPKNIQIICNVCYIAKNNFYFQNNIAAQIIFTNIKERFTKFDEIIHKKSQLFYSLLQKEINTLEKSFQKISDLNSSKDIKQSLKINFEKIHKQIKDRQIKFQQQCLRY